MRIAAEDERKRQEEVQRAITNFAESEDGIDRIVKRKATTLEEQQTPQMSSRKRLIDDTDRETQMKQLKEINPWLPQFTPQAEESRLKKPPKRPLSPMTSRPLRVSDLIPINMHRETEAGSNSSETIVKFICPVSRLVLPFLSTNLRLTPVVGLESLFPLRRSLQTRRATKSC